MSKKDTIKVLEEEIDYLLDSKASLRKELKEMEQKAAYWEFMYNSSMAFFLNTPDKVK